MERVPYSSSTPDAKAGWEFLLPFTRDLHEPNRRLTATGQDQAYGGSGNDRLHSVANDGKVDTLDCYDRAVIRQGDVTLNCEQVKTLPVTSAPVGEPGES